MNLKKGLILFSLSLLFLAGCASVPLKDSAHTININGRPYLFLSNLCQANGVVWEYDTFSRTAVLRKDSHKINLKVGDTLILVDGQIQHLNHPVDIYNGSLVVPESFNDISLNVFRKGAFDRSKNTLALSKINKVIIDAGHGGNDPGAIGKSGLKEKDVNLDLAKRLAKLLKERGLEVVLTRSNDTFISLARRVEIANNSKADLFISVHANANRVRSLNGFEIYYVSPAANDSRRALSAAEDAHLDINNDFFASQSLNLKATLWDMLYAYSRAESIELARSICKITNKEMDLRILGIKGANFYVLKGVRMPAVLIEVGFLSNHNEERLLKNGYYRQQIAEAIIHGIEDYASDSSMMEASR